MPFSLISLAMVNWTAPSEADTIAGLSLINLAMVNWTGVEGFFAALSQKTTRPE